MTQRQLRCGFTLIELLIVISILTLLAQMLLPAVEMSREAARQSHCANSLRQLTLAFHTHHDAHQHFPTSGWGWQWVGHPDRGFGVDQPGGWAYNVLPYIEQESIRRLGSQMVEGSREQQLEILRANATPIPIFNCPSRRLPRTLPMILTGFAVPNVGFSPLLPQECRDGNWDFCRVFRGDFAANSGNLNPGTESGPNALTEADGWAWQYWGPSGLDQNGVTHIRSRVRDAQISDGLSNVFCLGEKYVPVAEYKNGYYQNDNQSIFVGHDGDINRYTADVDGRIRRITSDTELPTSQQFGSAHPTAFNMSRCDGSVVEISYAMDPQVFKSLGGRDDGG